MSEVVSSEEVRLPRLPRSAAITERSRYPLLALRGTLLIVLAFVVTNLIVPPLFESPMVDDWSYALTVKRLVEDQQFAYPGWTAITLVSQTLWGGLFSLPFGFSFGALHVSTGILGLAGLLALYALGKELGLSEGRSTLLALTLYLNPVYLGLSYTFMSEVPSNALATIALWLYIRAARQHSRRWWLRGSVFCALAFLSRQTGLVVALAAALWLFWQGPIKRDTWRNIAAASGLPLLIALGYSIWLIFVSSIPEGYTYNAAQLSKLPLEVAARNVLVIVPTSLFYLGLFSLPYIASLLPAYRRLLDRNTVLWTVRGLVATFTIAFVFLHWNGWLMPYYRFGSMLNLNGVGPNNLLGERPVILGFGEQSALTAMAAGGAVVLMVIAFRQIRASRLPGSSPIVLIALVALAQVLWLTFGYLYLWDWFIFDRYLLPVLPPALVLLGLATTGIRVRWLLATPVLIAFGAYSIMGTHDWISYRQAAWAAGQTLVDQGVPLRSIDAGFEWAGWQLYEFSQTHPEEWHHQDASPFWIGRRVAPVITSEYIVAFSPLEDYSIMRTVPYSSWLTFKEEYLYVLRQQDGG